MSDTDSHDQGGFATRRDTAPGRGLTTPRRLFPGTPPSQRAGTDPGLPTPDVPTVPWAPPAVPWAPGTAAPDRPSRDTPATDPAAGGSPGHAQESTPPRPGPGRGDTAPRHTPDAAPPRTPTGIGIRQTLHTTVRPRTPLRAVGSPVRRRPDPNLGLFDVDTVTWQLHCDPLIGLAGLRGLLLHALHPLAIGVVDAHSHHQWDPWLRLARTAEYVGVTTYGTAAEAMLAGSRLRAVHARVHGTTRSGRPYTADDPNLLAWVHACLVASFLEIVTRGGMSLTGQQQDDYIGEQVCAATLVGLEPHEVPRDRASLVAYFRRLRPALTVTPPAQAAALSVVHGEDPRLAPGAPVPQRPVWAGVAGLAFATLPPWARRLYALPELPGAAGLSDAAATVALRELRTSLRNARSEFDRPR
jgi:uncharacterized protein (DUF2236 family)